MKPERELIQQLFRVGSVIVHTKAEQDAMLVHVHPNSVRIVEHPPNPQCRVIELRSNGTARVKTPVTKESRDAHAKSII